MSLDYLEEEIDDYRAQATRLVDNYSQTQAEVAADPNLTEIGKREAIAPLHEEVTAKVSALRAREKEAVTRKREALEKSLFGISAGSSHDVVAYRDAQDRARQLRSVEDAQEAYTDALRSDDHVLAKAILSRALTYNWTAITNDYRSRNPSAGTAINDLAQLTKFEDNGLMQAMNYMVPSLSTTAPVTLAYRG